MGGYPYYLNSCSDKRLKPVHEHSAGGRINPKGISYLYLAEIPSISRTFESPKYFN